MRIIITKNGTKFIQDLSPNTINHNNSENHSDLNLINFRLKNLKKNKSVNQIKNLKINNKYYSLSLTNLNNSEGKRELNNVLNNVAITNNKSDNINNLKMIKLKNNKKIKLPKILENKYLLFDSMEDEKRKKKYIPEILLSINESIDNELSNNKFMRRTKTLSDLNNTNIYMGNNKKNLIGDIPKIRESFPLKYIIGKDSFNRLDKEMKKLEKDFNIKNKLFSNNYFIKNNLEDLKKKCDNSLKNEINSKNINLIEYLNKDKNISNIFLQKFSSLNKKEINKLDIICKKALFFKKQDEEINKNIKNKIKTNLMNINLNFRQSLNYMNNKLNKYKIIMNKEKEKFSLNDKNRYIDQFIDAEKNWDKYNLERLYKKSISPRRSIYRPLLE